MLVLRFKCNRSIDHVFPYSSKRFVDGGRIFAMQKPKKEKKRCIYQIDPIRMEFGSNEICSSRVSSLQSCGLSPLLHALSKTANVQSQTYDYKGIWTIILINSSSPSSSTILCGIRILVTLVKKGIKYSWAISLRMTTSHLIHCKKVKISFWRLICRTT